MVLSSCTENASKQGKRCAFPCKDGLLSWDEEVLCARNKPLGTYGPSIPVLGAA